MTSQNVTGTIISDILERDHLTRQVPLVEQELLTHLEHLSSPLFLVGLVLLNLSFMCMFFRSLFVLLCFFFWPLCCLFFFELRILIISLCYLRPLFK